MPIDLEKDAGLHVPSNKELAQVSELANLQLSLEAAVADLEAKLEAKAKELRRVSEITLPQAMMAAGIEETKLANGARISIKKDMSISVPKHKLPAICAWLVANNFDDIIKKDVSIPLGKGTDPKLIERLRKGIEKLGLVYAEEEGVNSSTLKALLKEQIEAGKTIQLEDFGAYSYTKAVIKLTK